MECICLSSLFDGVSFAKALLCSPCPHYGKVCPVNRYARLKFTCRQLTWLTMAFGGCQVFHSAVSNRPFAPLVLIASEHGHNFRRISVFWNYPAQRSPSTIWFNLLTISNGTCGSLAEQPWERPRSCEERGARWDQKVIGREFETLNNWRGSLESKSIFLCLFLFLIGSRYENFW